MIFRLALLLMVVSTAGWGQSHGTIFVVRHAEKQTSSGAGMKAPDDPQLTDVGRQRAACLARTLKDSGISTVITSGVTRTNQTAEPFAAAAHLELKKLPSITETVSIARQASSDGNVLIVGHSNTIPEIMKGLAQTTVTIPDEAFDLMFIVTPGSTPQVATIHFCPAGK